MLPAWWRVIALFVLAGLPGFSQTTTSTITGKVHDASGGVISGVQVTVTHVETGQTRSVTTNTAGRYVFAALPVGAYELRAQFTGFRPVVQKGIRITVAETAVLDIEMAVGAVDQEVTVTASAAVV